VYEVFRIWLISKGACCMKKVACFLVGMLAVFVWNTAAVCPSYAETESTIGRFVVEQVTIDKEFMPLLLDTKTGKVWILESERVTGAKVFTGITVEGVAFRKASIEDVYKQVQQWHADGLVDKDVKGFREKMAEEFSYGLDSERARGINDAMKATGKK